MIAPLIHLNGTHSEVLVNDWRRAVTTLRLATESMESMAFNQRDYYPLGDEAWRAAKERREKMISQLHDLQMEATRVWIDLLRQVRTSKGEAFDESEATLPPAE